MKIEKTEVIHYVDKGISTILKGLFCMLAIWFGIWLINIQITEYPNIDLKITTFLYHIFGGAMVGAAWVRLIFILIKELW